MGGVASGVVHGRETGVRGCRGERGRARVVDHRRSNGERTTGSHQLGGGHCGLPVQRLDELVAGAEQMCDLAAQRLCRLGGRLARHSAVVHVLIGREHVGDGLQRELLGAHLSTPLLEELAQLADEHATFLLIGLKLLIALGKLLFGEFLALLLLLTVQEEKPFLQNVQPLKTRLHLCECRIAVERHQEVRENGQGEATNITTVRCGRTTVPQNTGRECTQMRSSMTFLQEALQEGNTLRGLNHLRAKQLVVITEHVEEFSCSLAHGEWKGGRRLNKRQHRLENRLLGKQLNHCFVILGKTPEQL
mmetsp:Transcript_33976/g.85282  ORF Transcript_33976/g.85282 Transcript_33976/m.85282 type:complete len:305 (+) Transcript_33976:710-1624(+)